MKAAIKFVTQGETTLTVEKRESSSFAKVKPVDQFSADLSRKSSLQFFAAETYAVSIAKVNKIFVVNLRNYLFHIIFINENLRYLLFIFNR